MEKKGSWVDSGNPVKKPSERPKTFEEEKEQEEEQEKEANPSTDPRLPEPQQHSVPPRPSALIL